MKRLVLVTLLLGACSTQAPDATSFGVVEYQVVGGKSGAPVEVMQVNCQSLELTLQRQTQQGNSIYQHQAQVTAADCSALLEQVVPLCRNWQGAQQGSFDVGQYRLSCHIEAEKTELRWQGTLSKGPDGLKAWHQQSRQLLQRLFPEVVTY